MRKGNKFIGGIKDRIPKTAQAIEQLEAKFVSDTEKLSLKDLTLDELVNRFEDIEQQGQLLQGKILLEARARFPSDKEFGQWSAKNLPDMIPQQKTKLMNLARFFEKRPLEKISITAAYELSAPINLSVSESVYEYVRNKNIPSTEVKKLIAKAKAETMPLPIKEESKEVKPVAKDNDVIDVTPLSEIRITGSPLVEHIDRSNDQESGDNGEIDDFNDDRHNTVPKFKDEKEIENYIMSLVDSLSPTSAIMMLKNCIDNINIKRYPKR